MIGSEETVWQYNARCPSSVEDNLYKQNGLSMLTSKEIAEDFYKANHTIGQTDKTVWYVKYDDSVYSATEVIRSEKQVVIQNASEYLVVEASKVFKTKNEAHGYALGNLLREFQSVQHRMTSLTESMYDKS